MRLFVALELPENVISELGRLRDTLKGAKMNKVRGFHLTLKFLGDVDETTLGTIIEQLTTVSFEQFKAELSIVGVFPSQAYAKVVWVGVAPAEGIQRLQADIDATLSGLFPKEKDFVPHITLARVKFVENKVMFQQLLEKIKPDKLQFNISKFALIKSTLTPAGPEHETIRKFS